MLTAIHNSLTTQHNALRAIHNGLTTKHNALTTRHNGLKLWHSALQHNTMHLQCIYNALTTSCNTFSRHNVFALSFLMPDFHKWSHNYQTLWCCLFNAWQPNINNWIIFLSAEGEGWGGCFFKVECLIKIINYRYSYKLTRKQLPDITLVFF